VTGRARPLQSNLTVTLRSFAQDYSLPRCGLTKCNMTTHSNDYYVVTFQRSERPDRWCWGIQRKSKPLGIKMTGDGFQSEMAMELLMYTVRTVPPFGCDFSRRTMRISQDSNCRWLNFIAHQARHAETNGSTRLSGGRPIGAPFFATTEYHSRCRREILLAVPELTRSADIKLNQRVLLRGPPKQLTV
jgi:hypothetical protein